MVVNLQFITEVLKKYAMYANVCSDVETGKRYMIYDNTVLLKDPENKLCNKLCQPVSKMVDEFSAKHASVVK